MWIFWPHIFEIVCIYTFHQGFHYYIQIRCPLVFSLNASCNSLVSKGSRCDCVALQFLTIFQALLSKEIATFFRLNPICIYIADFVGKWSTITVTDDIYIFQHHRIISVTTGDFRIDAYDHMFGSWNENNSILFIDIIGYCRYMVIFRVEEKYYIAELMGRVMNCVCLEYDHKYVRFIMCIINKKIQWNMIPE